MANTQVTFSSVNPTAPAHLLAEGEVQSALNVDFSLGQGCAMPRRGSIVYGSLGGSSPIIQVFRAYTVADNIDANPFYALDSAGVIFRGSNSTWTAISSSPYTVMGINSYQQYALIAGGTNFVKDDGTLTTDWIKQAPGTPTITVNTLTAVAIGGDFSIIEGTGTGTATVTVTSDDQNIAVVLKTFSGGTNLDTNGTNSIGAFGVHFVDMSFDNPINIIRVSQDFAVTTSSILTTTATVSGTTTSTITNTFINFDSYWHAEVNPSNGMILPAQPDPNILINSQLSVGTSTTTTPDLDQRARMISEINNSQNPTLNGLSQLGVGFSPWGVCRPDFRMVGTFAPSGSASPWGNILAMRYVFQYNDVTVAQIKNPAIYGAQNYPLNDINVGLTYWETFATLDAQGNKVSESAASPPTHAYQMQQANVKVVSAGTATGSHGITHRITYRQGGYLQSAYAVNTRTLATTTFTDTVNDIQALSDNWPITLNLYDKGSFPATVFSIASIFQKRVFVAERNYLRWSLPNQIDSFPKQSFVAVSNIGDNIKGLVPWPPGLIIVNQDSVFELTGNDFEGGDYQITPTGARKGCFAPRSIIRTPYGIPLINYDGLSFYKPGQGVDVELPWLNQKYGDIFKGGNSNDPAARKGSRVPAINYGHMQEVCAAYAEGKLYLGAATGTSTLNDTVYVIDLQTEKVWWYQYPFNVWSLFWDYQNSRLMAGSDNDTIMQLEHGAFDAHTTSTANSQVGWNLVTREWSVNNDTVMENISIEAQVGTSSSYIQVAPTYDGGSPVTASTLTNTIRAWTTPPLNGTFANNARFAFTGLGSGPLDALYQMTFDLLPEPVKVQYYRTPYDTHNYEGDKLWDVAYHDINILPGITTATGTQTNTQVSVLAVTFVDNTAVMTNTLTGPTASGSNSGRVVFEFAFPPEIYGRIAFTTYTIGTLTTGTFTNTASNFKLWQTRFDARDEPPKINYWRTDIESLEENICDAFDVDINPNGTALATSYVDNTAIQTNTITGNNRQSFTFAYPVEQYGRTIYVAYTGTGIKHYKTWFHLRLEPDRHTQLVTNKISGDEHEWKVFKPELNCLGQTVLCTAFIDGTAINTFTATGTVRKQYTFSLPTFTFGRTIHAAYSASGVFKHYPPLRLDGSTAAEFEGSPEPPRVTVFRTGPYPFP